MKTITGWKPFAEWSEAQKRKFREAKAAQDSQEKDGDIKAKVAIHTDKLYLGYNRGLGVRLQGRRHFKEVLKRGTKGFPQGLEEVG